MANNANPHINDRLVECADAGDLAGVARLLAMGASPGYNGSLALSRAASNGHAECVKLLIPASAPKTENSRALRSAAAGGRLECIKLLLPVCDPKANDSEALRFAAHGGHAECVKLLLPASAPLTEIEGILSEALGSGHAGTLSAMLSHEPRLLDQVNLAATLDAAVAEGHFDLQFLLRSIIEQQGLDAHVSLSNAATHKPSRL